MSSSSSLYLVQTVFIIIPAMAGWYRFKELDKGHRFFFSYLMLSAAFYFSNYITVEITIKTNISYVWYSISASLLFLTLYAWENTLGMKKIFRLFAFLSPLLIAAEFVVRWGQVIKTPSFSFILISLFFSIMILPQLLDEFTNNKSVWKNSKILILVPLMLSFLLNALLHIMYLSIFSPSTQIMLGQSSFVLRMFFFLSYFSFTIAMLWAPRKEIFI